MAAIIVPKMGVIIVLVVLFACCVNSKVVRRQFETEEEPNETGNKILDNDVINNFPITHLPQVRHSEFKRHRLKEDRYLDKSLDINMKYCRRPAKCHVLNDTICMGSKLPYTISTLDLTDLKKQEEVHDKLQLYQYLRYIPKCWAVIQPFLCALYMPKCVDGWVDLPSREMCRITLGPCKILYNSTIFPDFMNCDNDQLFPSKCKNDIHELKFNTTGYCLDPLVKTDQQDWFYEGSTILCPTKRNCFNCGHSVLDIEGCGLRCKDSLYTENEHHQIHKLVAYCVLLCIFLHLFTIMTFLVDWRTANKYPALAIFYINICFFVSYSGWLIQFLGYETREDIVCKKDGTLRKSEPSASENLSCVIVFVMVYYFLVAGMVWFVIFTYAWHMSSLQALGKSQERVDKKRAYFHLVAWSLPLIMTITTMALGEIDGDYVTGICFVGFVNGAARAGLLLAPLAAAMIVSGYIICRGLILLIRVKIESREIISAHSSRKIRSNIVRMSVFALFMVVFCVITFVYHGYINENSELWSHSLRDFIVCKLTSLSTDYSHCRQESRPSVAMLQLQLLAVFGAGIAMASWIWCAATIHAWTRYVRRKFHCEVDEPMKLQKHQIIAEAYAQRQKFNEGGRISIEFQVHTDPVGLHFDINSGASNELSTTWAAKLPRLMNRRGGIPDDVTCSVSSNNQSVDSEMSYSVRHVSIESRRNSGDSQVSVQIAEVTATRKARRHTRYRHNKKHNLHRGYKDIYKNSRKMSRNSKNNSNTSIDSFMMNVLNNAQEQGGTKTFAPNLNRRTANAGLDSQTISNLLSNGKLVIPYSKNGCVRSGSEDENVSVTYSERNFNVVVSNHANNMDLNDHLVLKSIRQGLHIQELSSSSDSDTKVNTEKPHYNRSDRDSKSSRRARRLQSKSERRSADESSSSCPELKQLVQSSLNSGTSIAHENNRDSKQSKTSIDVGCQANARDIDNQTSALDSEYICRSHESESKKSKSKRAKTKENKKYKENKYAEEEKYKKKDKYKTGGNSMELKSLKKHENKYSDNSDVDSLIQNKDKYKPKMMKGK